MVFEAAAAALPENQMNYDVRVFLYKGIDLEGAVTLSLTVTLMSI